MRLEAQPAKGAADSEFIESRMAQRIDEAALDTLVREARTHSIWWPKPVTDQTSNCATHGYIHAEVLLAYDDQAGVQPRLRNRQPGRRGCQQPGGLVSPSLSPLRASPRTECN